ncbi:DgyrCDS11691 [Dimorphilus gyrociliatus]|uniref:DgyrCDS11691 n=1 Tax=Dimorphilus gyrociliatus TaxID=2664684 RepID=A0A7I8W4A6_9ANNE|nr:DgyrCDS11691 [Dimorphilus gyrociliatus]
MALKRSKREIAVFLTNISTLSVGMILLCVAFGTDHWFTADLRDKNYTSTDEYYGSMYCGIFEGEMFRKTEHLGDRQTKLDVRDFISRNQLRRPYWAATISFLSVTLVVSCVTVGLVFLNIATKPVETYFGTLGLIFWFGVCLLSCVLAMSFWAAFHHVEIKENILNHLTPPWVVQKSYFALSLDVLQRKEVYYPDYTIYHNVSKIAEKMHHLSLEGNLIKPVPGYFSLDKKSQQVFHITEHNYKSNRKVNILLSSGEHAREFFPVEYTMSMIEQLIREKKYLLRYVNLFVIVLSNPDGREFVEKNKNYCWRGNRRGVDLNRNFDWNYGGIGSSDNPKDEEYRGEHILSEPEALVYLDLINQINFDFFISLHSGIRQIYVPFSDTFSKTFNRKPGNIESMLDLAKQLSQSTKYDYKYGQAYNLNFYTADGTIFDYMAGKKNIPFSLAIELWGNGIGECFDLFNPPSGKLKEEINALKPLFWKLVNYAINWKKKQLN